MNNPDWERYRKFNELRDDARNLSNLQRGESIVSATNIITRANTLLGEGDFIKSKNVNDVLEVDLEVLKMAGDVICDEVNALTSHKKYSPELFAHCLVNTFGKDEKFELNWDNFKINGFIRRAVLPKKKKIDTETFKDMSADVMRKLVPKSRGKKETKSRAKREKPDPKAVIKPENITANETRDRNNVVFNLILDIIKEECAKRPLGAINYCILVSDPESFDVTIDNMFQVSCLVAQGDVTMFKDQNGEILVKAVTAKQKRKGTYESEEAFQCILSIDIATWKVMIEVFNIRKALINIPNRYEQ